MTPEQLADLEKEIQEGYDSNDYYLGGYCSAALGLELVYEVKRLQTENAKLKERIEVIEENYCEYC